MIMPLRAFMLSGLLQAFERIERFPFHWPLKNIIVVSKLAAILKKASFGGNP